MMKSYRKELWFHIPSRRGFVNVTAQVEEAVRESGIKEGMVLVNAMNNIVLQRKVENRKKQNLVYPLIRAAFWTRICMHPSDFQPRMGANPI